MKPQSFFRILLFVAAVPLCLRAQDDFTNRLDEIFKPWSKPGTPGASVAVIQHGKVLVAKGYGLASLEYDVPVTPDTVYHVASVSKQFTAMALVLLEQDGKLSLEDDVHKYLPGLPDYGHPLTLRELLQHTSGIRDQWQTLALAGWRLDDVITQEQILRVLFRQKELNFVPGTRHLYSNGGYTLASEVVARVSGKKFPAFCQERIFRPLGMTHTHFHDDLRHIVRDRAGSYEKLGQGFQAVPLNYANVGATSLFTTPSDLVLWLDNFREPKVGGRAGVGRLQEPAVLADGKKIDYALGLAIGKSRGLKTISHSGGDAGYRSFVLWFPERELGVAVVSGLASFDSGGTGHKVARVFLDEEPAAEQTKPAPPPAEKPRQYITLVPSVLDRYVGHYALDVGLVADIRRLDNKLIGEVAGAEAQELHPLATNRFYLDQPGGEVEFLRRNEGPMRLKFTQEGAVITGERTALVPRKAAGLEEFQGTYWSEELETEYTILLKNGKLVAEHLRHGEIGLSPAGKDRFSTQEWFMPEVRFLRDSSNSISGLTLGGGRVTGIRFQRKGA
jgi:CubicO group peptidase (beta-lactamase class C family)